MNSNLRLCQWTSARNELGTREHTVADETYDVAVIGYGPVGMAMAALLGRMMRSGTLLGAIK